MITALAILYAIGLFWYGLMMADHMMLDYGHPGEIRHAFQDWRDYTVALVILLLMTPFALGYLCGLGIAIYEIRRSE
jgi:hypothetical protein